MTFSKITFNKIKFRIMKFIIVMLIITVDYNENDNSQHNEMPYIDIQGNGMMHNDTQPMTLN